MKSNEGIGEMGGGRRCGMWKCVVNVGTERWEVKGGSVREERKWQRGIEVAVRSGSGR
jgi:hypothetical protein